MIYLTSVEHFQLKLQGSLKFGYIDNTNDFINIY